MSRTKNKVTKMMAGESMAKKVSLAQYGDFDNSPLFHKANALINCIHGAAILGTFKKVNPKDRKWVKIHRENAWKALAAVTLEAFKAGDGEIFYLMGKAVELHQNPIDRRRALVFTRIGAAETFGLPVPTMSQLLKELGGKTRRRTLRENILKPAGVKLPKGKAGRPPKSK